MGEALTICGIYIEMFRNGNPYHNNLHAADVLQTTHWFISQAGLKVIFLKPLTALLILL